MAKEKTIYVCSACGYETPRWDGQMPRLQRMEHAGGAGTAGCTDRAGQGHQAAARHGSERPCAFPRCRRKPTARATTGIGELDRVLGGGVVEGSLMLVGGDPGIGKSTLLLQASEHLAAGGARVLYISGEESVRQIKMRARRLGVKSENLLVLERKRDGRRRTPLGRAFSGLYDCRFHPDDVSSRHGERAGQRFAGARMRQPADAHGKDDRDARFFSSGM